jgi:hypothetical protein
LPAKIGEPLHAQKPGIPVLLAIKLQAAMQPAAAAKVYEKNAWVLITIIGALGVFSSLMMIAGIGVPTLSGYSLYIARFGGISLFGYGITGMAVSMTAYKKGERWAWYVLWYLPIYFIVDTALTYQQGGSDWPVSIILTLISLAALLLPYRIFFPKK